MTNLATFDTLGIQTELIAILTGLDSPIKEYDLMLELTDRGFGGFADFGSDSFELFRAHFVLFNALYSLRGHLMDEEARILKSAHFGLALQEPRAMYPRR